MISEHEMNSGAVKWTGALYLLVIICAGTSQGYIRESLIIQGDVAVSALNILQNEFLFRLGISLDLIAFILDAAISILLYQIFKNQGKSLALISAAFRLIAHPAIGSLNLLNHYLAIHVLGEGSLVASFELDQIQALSNLFIDAHNYGYMIAGGFFGAHLVLLAIQLLRSDKPNFLSILIGLSAIGYLIETFGNFSFPGYEDVTAMIVGVTAAIGELTFTFNLLLSKSKK